MVSPQPAMLSLIASKRRLLVVLTLIFILVGFYYLQGLDNVWSLRSLIPLQLESNGVDIPRKIWYKLGPRGLSDEARTWTESCLQRNPEYEHEFMTDTSGDSWVQKTFATHPIVETYLNLTIPILKADLLRYLLLFANGGVYFDLDVTCHVPIEEWIPDAYRSSTSLVVGWEFDVGWGENIVREFATWTILARPRSPHLWSLILDINEALREKQKAYDLASVGQLELSMAGDVVDITGPRRFTSSILRSLEFSLETVIEIDRIKNLREPKLVGDVLILPGYALAAGSNHYGADEVLPAPLVTHHGAGTWKNNQGGETI